MEFLAFGGTIFYILMAIAFIAFIGLLENEKFIWSSILSIGLVLFFTFMVPNFSLFHWVVQNPWKALTYVGEYAAIGIAWGFIKWYVYVVGVRERYKSTKASYLSMHGLKDLSDARVLKDFMASYSGSILGRYQSRSGSIPPMASENVSRIINWISYWPMSFVWFIIQDPIRNAAFWIYRHILAGAYQKISNFVFRDFAELQEK